MLPAGRQTGWRRAWLWNINMHSAFCFAKRPGGPSEARLGGQRQFSMPARPKNASPTSPQCCPLFPPPRSRSSPKVSIPGRDRCMSQAGPMPTICPTNTPCGCCMGNPTITSTIVPGTHQGPCGGRVGISHQHRPPNNPRTPLKSCAQASYAQLAALRFKDG